MQCEFVSGSIDHASTGTHKLKFYSSVSLRASAGKRERPSEVRYDFSSPTDSFSDGSNTCGMYVWLSFDEPFIYIVCVDDGILDSTYRRLESAAI